MKLTRLVDWLDRTLDVREFSDVSNNGIQIARTGDDVRCVAFAVDASLASMQAAAAAGAQLLVVHHGISWGGGIRRIDGGVYNVVRAAMAANIALYAVHLPLDASRKCGNNFEIARALGLKRLRRAFVYHGETIGVVGEAVSGPLRRRMAELFPGADVAGMKSSGKVTLGVCSGGAGEFACDAADLGCDLYLTGEASWGDVIAAENRGICMVCAGHYETETFGVRALARELAAAHSVRTVFLPRA